MWKRFLRGLRDNTGSIVVIVFILLYCRFCVTAEVSGVSMQPTYNNGDYLLCIRTTNVSYGDTVAIFSEELGRNLCKRIIGVAGDHIVISNSKLVINDNVVHEDYIKDKKWGGGYNITVPDDKVFVLGDNRNDSLDSRSLGCLPKDAIIGKCIFNVTKYTFLDKDGIKIFLAVVWLLILVFYPRRCYNEKLHRHRRSDYIEGGKKR